MRAAAAVLLLLWSAPACALAWTPPLLAQLLAVAERAPEDGLPLEAARISQLHELLQARNFAATLTGYEIDAQASALFARLAVDFAAGRIDPGTVDPSWHIQTSLPDVDGLEARALASQDVIGVLGALAPQHPEYAALKLELACLRAQPQSAEIDRRLGKLRAALERWRWLPHVMPERRIEVRVPEFQLTLIDGGEPISHHRVVVGKTTTRTPTLLADANAVIFNPYWIPPESIIQGEIIPRLRRDPAYAAREDFEILDAQGTPADPSLIDWSTERWKYHIRQTPGPNNALGLVKIDMPNPYAIYLHDTPARTLFSRVTRTFSHGCIRVEGALELANSLLPADEHEQEFIAFALSSGLETKVPLRTPVPVFILYLTAAQMAGGGIAYFDDIYNRDKALAAALDAAMDRAMTAAPAPRGF